MLSWIGRLLGSSIGKKAVMAISGLALSLFLLGHLAGNLTLFADADGATFDAYADALRHNPLLPLAEIGLIALFSLHIGMAVKVTLENRASRGHGYRERATKGARTPASASMFITGAIVMVFLIVHLLDFRLSVPETEPLSTAVQGRFSSVGKVTFYAISMVALGMHLGHALSSALQTLGINHPRYNALIRTGSIGLAVLLALGFASMPIYFLLFFQGGAH